jgi:hypothetical protein
MGDITGLIVVLVCYCHDLGCRALEITMLYMHRSCSHVCAHDVTMKYNQLYKDTPTANYVVPSGTRPDVRMHNLSYLPLPIV